MLFQVLGCGDDEAAHGSPDQQSLTKVRGGEKASCGSCLSESGRPISCQIWIALSKFGFLGPLGLTIYCDGRWYGSRGAEPNCAPQ